MPYELYTRSRVRTGTPTLTITTLGRISLNKAASHFLEAKSAKYLQILWDKENKRAAFKVVPDSNVNAYRISYGVKGNGAGFSAKTFLEHIGYDQSSKTKSFRAEWNEPENMLEVELTPEDFTTDNGQVS